jgi:hypothetical protein
MIPLVDAPAPFGGMSNSSGRFCGATGRGASKITTTIQRGRIMKSNSVLVGALAVLCTMAGGCAHWPATSLTLPKDQVDKLREVAGRLLRQAPAFQALLSDLQQQR